MNSEIIGLTNWLQTSPGEYLLAWEGAQFDEAVADIFGFHALQMGLPELDTLSANRIPHRWLAESSIPLSKSKSDSLLLTTEQRLTSFSPLSSRP